MGAHYDCLAEVLLMSTHNRCFYEDSYVNGGGSITSVGEERANLPAVVYL